MDARNDRHPALTFEFFPPKTEAGVGKLRTTWRQLAKCQPRFFSCTYGAGGSTRDRTLETVLAIQSDGWSAAPHLCCAGATRDEIVSTLEQYRYHGVRHLVALRGDVAADAATAGRGDFRYANELVTCIREETGDHFHIAVACYPECHPQANSARDDFRNFKRKIDAGADVAITQYFYNVDAYCRFVDDCADAGIDVPIVPGIMPIGNLSQLMRFSSTCGAEIPRWLRMRLQSYAHDVESVSRFGLDVVTELCQRVLAAGAPGLHFYTLNDATLTLSICQQLGLWPSPSSVHSSGLGQPPQAAVFA